METGQQQGPARKRKRNMIGRNAKITDHAIFLGRSSISTRSQSKLIPDASLHIPVDENRTAARSCDLARDLNNNGHLLSPFNILILKNNETETFNNLTYHTKFKIQ